MCLHKGLKREGENNLQVLTQEFKLIIIKSCFFSPQNILELISGVHECSVINFSLFKYIYEIPDYPI